MSLEKPHNDQQDHDVTGELNYFKFKLFQSHAWVKFT